MIVEERIYTLYPGKQAEYLKHYQEEGLEVQSRILGRMVGYFTTEVGPLNQVIHMWGYDSFEERLRRRAELFKDPTWLGYVAKIRPLILSQENKILLPTPFSPIR
jgi:hypothetical protein